MYVPLYTRPCNNIVRYTRNRCFGSNVNKGYRYIWQPNQDDDKAGDKRFEWHAWNKRKMCEIMRGRNLLIMGDSLSEELYLTLVSAALAEFFVEEETFAAAYSFNSTHKQAAREQIEKLRSEKLGTCLYFCEERAAACVDRLNVDCGAMPNFEVSFQWSDHLILQEGEEWNNFAERLRTHNVNMIWMNTGAHYYDSINLLPELANTMRRIYALDGNISVVYRSTPPGHMQCEKSFAVSPINSSVEEAAANVFVLNMAAKSSYHWSDFDVQNEAIREMLRQQFPQTLLVDVFNSTLLRPDAHVGGVLYDCLHYCTPGPVDGWLEAIFNALMRVFSHHTEVAEAEVSLHSSFYKEIRVSHGAEFPFLNSWGLQASVDAPPPYGVVVWVKYYEGLYLLEDGKRRIFPDSNDWVEFIKECGAKLHAAGVNTCPHELTLDDFYLLEVGAPLQRGEANKIIKKAALSDDRGVNRQKFREACLRGDLSHTLLYQSNSTDDYVFFVDSSGARHKASLLPFTKNDTISNVTQLLPAYLQPLSLVYISQDDLFDVKETEPFPPFKNGDLVRGTGKAVYFVENGTKRMFPSGEVFISHGFEWDNIHPVLPEALDLLPLGPDMRRGRRARKKIRTRG